MHKRVMMRLQHAKHPSSALVRVPPVRSLNCALSGWSIRAEESSGMNMCNPGPLSERLFCGGFFLSFLPTKSDCFFDDNISTITIDFAGQQGQESTEAMMASAKHYRGLAVPLRQ
jgi:hypothetical protein